MKTKTIFIFTILFSTLLNACNLNNNQKVQLTTEPTAQNTIMVEELEENVPNVQEVEDVLYLNIIWHQHQPLYYKDENGIYTRPWVRAHATKDYYDMASILKDYPEVNVTFNLTPVLLKQLNDYSKNGAIDTYWELSLIPANELSKDQKTFILERFFDANWDHIIARFPRYQELLDLRGGSDSTNIENAISIFSDQDFLDLQIWFNLAWFDPEFLLNSPLNELVEKGKNFSESDKVVVFAGSKKNYH